MIIENRLKQHFNGFLFFMRITFFAIGIMFIINHRWWSSVVFLFFALLTFYTVSGTAIDLNLRRVKSYYLIFGIIKTGNWQPIEDYEKLKVVPVSHGNPVMNILDKKGLKEVDEYRVILKSKTKPTVIYTFYIVQMRNRVWSIAKLQALRSSRKPMKCNPLKK